MSEKRNRDKRIQVWLSDYEKSELIRKSEKANLSESELMRMLILGYEPREAPSEKLYEFIKELRHIGNNLNQIAYKANAIGFIDVDFYKQQVEILNNFIKQIKEEFLLPKKRN